MLKPVHVAVGIIRNENDEILIALRSEDKHQGGLWEFPGGKVEYGESVVEALGRELREELDLQILGASPLLMIEHDYGDKPVLLDVWAVNGFQGRASGMEGQELKWVAADKLKNYDFPGANLQIVDFLTARA